MKVIVIFDSPEEDNELLLALHGKDYWNALWTLRQDIWSKLKYGHNIKTADEAFEWVNNHIHNNANLDEIE